MTVSDVGTFTYESPSAEQLAQAERWVAGFAARWDRPDGENLRDLMHPDTQNLIPPMERPGNAQEVIDHFKELVARVPGFRIEVQRWAPVGDSVMIEWAGHATIGGRDLTWHGVDRVSLRDGKTYEGQAYWDTRAVSEMILEALAAASAAQANLST